VVRKKVYKVTFSSQGKVYEIYAQQVEQAPIYGFVEVEGLLFGERSSIVVDPGEEHLKHEFSGVRKFMIPYHAVIRIDEVEKEGTGKVLQLAGQTGTPPLFQPVPPPGKGPSGD
jgi:hypothetical protein